MKNYWKITDEDIRTVLFRYRRRSFGKRAITRARVALNEEKVVLAAEGECGDIAEKMRAGYDEIKRQLSQAMIISPPKTWRMGMACDCWFGDPRYCECGTGDGICRCDICQKLASPDVLRTYGVPPEEMCAYVKENGPKELLLRSALVAAFPHTIVKVGVHQLVAKADVIDGEPAAGSAYYHDLLAVRKEVLGDDAADHPSAAGSDR